MSQELKDLNQPAHFKATTDHMGALTCNPCARKRETEPCGLPAGLIRKPLLGKSKIDILEMTPKLASGLQGHAHTHIQALHVNIYKALATGLNSVLKLHPFWKSS